MRSKIRRFKPTIISLATAYDDQSAELVIPETFDTLDDSALAQLYSDATAAFDAMLEDAGDNPSAEQLEQLASLTEGIEALSTEKSSRAAAQSERAEQAAALAARVRGSSGDEADGELSANTEEEGADSTDEDEEEDSEEEGDNSSEDDNAAQTITASAARRGDVRIPLSGLRRQNPRPPANQAPSERDVLISSGEGTGFAVGQGLTLLDVGKAIDKKLAGYNAAQYAAAHKTGLARREQHSIVSLKREFAADSTIGLEDSMGRIDDVISRVTDEHQVRGKNGATGLVASGGWCAPSETTYELIGCDASMEGLLSLPEVGITRGGLRFPVAPSFQEVYDAFPGFHFTEEQDIEGEYQPGAEGNVVGPKPCVKVDCPDWEDLRLEVDGLCIQAGILQSRGFPEYIARTVQQALVAHAHRMSAAKIARIVAGSEAVAFPANQAGATAPILTAIELHSEHIRYVNRLARGATLEGIMPYWVRGAIRADLARRQGIALFEVSNAEIDSWFVSHGIAPQYVYDWQPLTGAASTITSFPASVQIAMYPAGTWFAGAADLITLDTVYDSTLLSTNDFTSLFTEEGWLVGNRGCSSRVLTVPICPDGATHQGIAIECNGTVGAAAVVPGATAETPLFTSEVP